MSNNKSISVPKNWQTKMFGLENRLSMMIELLKMFTLEAVEAFREKGRLRQALKYMEIVHYQIRSNKYPFPLKFPIGNIELGSTLEGKLANLFIPEVIVSLKEKGRLRDALRYLDLLFPEPFRTPQVNDVLTSTKYTLGIQLKTYIVKGVKKSDVNVANLDINLFNILPDIVEVYKEVRPDKDVVITSGNDGTHKGKNETDETKRSKHYQNKAIDLRSNDLTDSKQLDLANKLKKRLGKNFYVLSEHYACKANNHIHIGYQIANTQEAGIYTECKIKKGIQRIVDITDTDIKSEKCIKDKNIQKFYIRKWNSNGDPLYCE